MKNNYLAKFCTGIAFIFVIIGAFLDGYQGILAAFLVSFGLGVFYLLMKDILSSNEELDK
jgi:hypothetical protein